MKTKFIDYLKSLNWKMLIILVVFSFFLAVINNIFTDNSKSVEWIGSQPVLDASEQQ